MRRLVSGLGCKIEGRGCFVLQNMDDPGQLVFAPIMVVQAMLFVCCRSIVASANTTSWLQN